MYLKFGYSYKYLCRLQNCLDHRHSLPLHRPFGYHRHQNGLRHHLENVNKQFDYSSSLVNKKLYIYMNIMIITSATAATCSFIKARTLR